MNGILKTAVTGIAGCGMLALLGMNSTAQAVPLTQGMETTFTVNFNGTDGDVPTVDPGLTGEAIFSFDGNIFNGDTYIIDVTLENTTDITYWSTSRISRMLFDIDPNETLDSASASGDWTATVLYDELTAHQYGEFDVCVGQATMGGSFSCSGGSGGPEINETISFSIALTYSDPVPASINLTNFGVRYQSLTTADGSFTSGSGAGIGTPGDPVDPDPIPEPALVAMLGVGMLGIGGLMGWRRRQD